MVTSPSVDDKPVEIEVKAPRVLASFIRGLDDAELFGVAKRERGRSDVAFREIVRRFEPVVHRTALRYLGSAAEADDAMQEVFIRVFRFIDGFDGRASPKSWLYRIVQNVCATRYAKRRRRHEGREAFGAHKKTELPEPSRSGSTGILRVDGLTAATSNALESLSAEDREVLILRAIGDLSIDEIAQILDLSLSATKMRLKRARERFKAHREQKGDVR